MDLISILEGINETVLTKTQLEDLYAKFLHLFSVTEMRLGELEKLEAIFMEAHKDETVAAGKRLFKATQDGLELITLKRQSNVLEKNLSAIRHRVYSQY